MCIDLKWTLHLTRKRMFVKTNLFCCGVKSMVYSIWILFILQYQCAADGTSKFMTYELINSSLAIDQTRGEPCQRGLTGKGIFIGRIVIKIKEQHLCTRDLKQSSNVDTILRQTFGRECNGKSSCNLSDSIKQSINVNCENQILPGNRIDINYQCKPIEPDNKQFFSRPIMPELSTKVTGREFNTSYLVLELQRKRPTDIHCEINGNNKEFKLTILHLDFGPNLECHTTNMCYGYINVTDEKNITVNYTFNWLPIEQFNKYLKIVTFDVSMSTGLLWIQLEGYTEINIDCRNINDRMTTDGGEIQTSEVTIPQQRRKNETKMKETSATVAAVGSTREENGTEIEVDIINDHAPQSFQLEMVVPVSVAGILVLFLIVLCIACVCSTNSPFQSWKRNRIEFQKVTRYPLKDKCEYETTNDVLDQSPDLALTIKTNTHNGDDSRTCNDLSMEIPSYQETSFLKTPTKPASSQWPATRVPNGQETDDSVESTYATADDNEAMTPVLGISVTRSIHNTANVAETGKTYPPGEETEYSHLNQFTDKRNFENVYNV